MSAANIKKEEQEKIQLKTAHVLSSMTPGSLTSLASEDVSYIIIKSEDGVFEAPISKKKRVKVLNLDKEVKEVAAKKQKEAQAIK
jgi:hypothetical protein